MPLKSAAFLAGAATLAIELVWIRLLSLAFGSASLAAGAVVSALMLGMAIGSAWAARPAPRPLRLLGTALLGLAGAAAASASVVRGTGGLGVAGPLLAGLFMAVASIPMGMAVPLLAAGTGSAGALYASSTLGSALGALGTGFLLLPALGNQTTLLVASGPLAALGLFLLRTKSVPPIPEAPPVGPPGRPAGILVAYALSAFAAMATEIGWMRALVLSIGSSTYAYTLVLGVYIAGLGIGSALAARFLRSARSPSTAFGSVQLLIALSCLGTLMLLGRLPALFGGMLFERVNSLGSFLGVALLVASASLLLPSIAVGTCFPVAVGWAGRRAAGLLLAAATGGSMAGALVGSFLSIPAIGIEGTLGAALLLHAILGSVVLSFAAGRRRLWPSLAAALISAALFLRPSWDPRVLQSGPYINDPGSIPRSVSDPRKVLFSRDDRVASVAVFELPGGNRVLRIDGKTDASMTQIDQVTQLLTAHIPLSIHGHAERVAVIGLGSGMTVASCLKYAPREVHAIEISPAVVRASHFFDEYTGNPLGDRERVTLHVADARAVMRRPGPAFDVIINEPSNLWIAGMAGLFTEEFYRSCAARLADGGLMCQWIHAYGVTEPVFRDAVATFLRVFPHATLWEIVISGDYLLLGSPRPYRIDVELMARQLSRPAVREDLRWIDVRSVAGILGDLVAETRDLEPFLRGARVQTDDGLHLEFQAPIGFYGRRRIPPLDVLPEVHPESLGPIVQGRAVDWGEARALLREATKAILDQKDPIDRVRLLERALERFPEERQARLLLEGETQGCVLAADEALRHGDSSRFSQLIEAVPAGTLWYPAARFRRIGMLRKAGAPPAELGIEYRKILDAAPGLETAVIPYVETLLGMGAAEEAERVAREGVEHHPKSARIRLARARSLLELGRRPEAAAECDEAVRLDPSGVTAREAARLLGGK
jgi:spermidine synthase